jgi:probable O-glycosylation ligase (exosortase A-associated)
MRDLVIMLVIVGLALVALKRPWVGAMLWTWIGLMNPHVEFGYASASRPYALVAAAATLLGLIFTTERRNPLDSLGAKALLAFTVWVTITLPFSIYFELSYPLWERSMKIFLMIFVTIALIDDKRKLDWFIGICTFSIAFYGIKGGIFAIQTGGSYRIWGPGGFIGGNNEIGLAILMVVPLLYYAYLQANRKWLRWGLMASMPLCMLATLTTHSRGALLGLAAMTAFLWLKTKKNKLQMGLLIVLAVAVILPFMPQHWWDRMDTIQTYEEDDSALGRINAWIMAWNLAWDRVVGGGFQIYYYDVFVKYSPDPGRVHAAHSIYFQVLGEHGFIGLFIFLSIGVFTWLEARKLIAIGDSQPQHKWAADLARMVQVSMIGFSVGGAFLSLAYWDMPYNLTVMLICATYVVRKRVQPDRLSPPASTLGCQPQHRTA